MIDILNVMIGMNMHDGVPVIPETEEYIKKLIKALKPGGFLVIADFYPYRDCPHVSPEQAEAFMKKFGLEKAEQIEACSAPSAMYAVTFCRTGGSL